MRRTYGDSHHCCAGRVRAAWIANWFANRSASVRKAKLHRKTAETEIRIALTIEGRGKYDISTGIRFLDHMLELFTRHCGVKVLLLPPPLSCRGVPHSSGGDRNHPGGG